MELKIISKKENPLLNRTEMEYHLSFFNEPTPKKEDVKKKAAAAAKAEEKVMVIKKIKNDFGTGAAKALVYIYNSEEDLKRIEPKEKAPKTAAPKEEAKNG